jgi:hypothetical protein
MSASPKADDDDGTYTAMNSKESGKRAGPTSRYLEIKNGERNLMRVE